MMNLKIVSILTLIKVIWSTNPPALTGISAAQLITVIILSHLDFTNPPSSSVSASCAHHYNQPNQSFWIGIQCPSLDHCRYFKNYIVQYDKHLIFFMASLFHNLAIEFDNMTVGHRMYATFVALDQVYCRNQYPSFLIDTISKTVVSHIILIIINSKRNFWCLTSYRIWK